MKLKAFVDRVERDSLVLYLSKFDEVIYLPREIFGTKLCEGVWVDIEIKINSKKTKKEKLSIANLQKKLLKRTKKFKK